jgi:DNA-binding response OmpR family regulator
MIAKTRKRSNKESPRRSVTTVLLVEGEVLVRMVLAEYLRDCEYRVLEASSSDEAKTLLSAPDLAVDVVLADLDVADAAGGFALAQWLRSERPNIKVILTSGVARSADAAADLCDQGPLMRRPYQPREVERRIRALLARSGE